MGIDEIAIRKGHAYRIVVSDLDRGRPIWFGGKGLTQMRDREWGPVARHERLPSDP